MWPRGGEDDVGGFGVPADVEGHAGAVEDLVGELVGLAGGVEGDGGRETAALEGEVFGERGEGVVETDGEGEVGDGAEREDGDFVRVLVDDAGEEGGGDAFTGLDGGFAFAHGRDDVRAVRSDAGYGVVGGPGLGPCAFVSHVAVELLPAAAGGLRVDEREAGAVEDRDVGVSGELQHAKGVGDAFFVPTVAGLDGDAEDLDGGVVEEHEHGLHGGVAGAVGVLVDDDEAFVVVGRLCGGEGSACEAEQQQRQEGLAEVHALEFSAAGLRETG